MAKVNLFFDVFQDKELEKKSGKYEIIRLKCRVRFKISNGWSEPYSAILDTGAHTPPLFHYQYGKRSKPQG